jgi:hypothetical protein
MSPASTVTVRALLLGLTLGAAAMSGCVAAPGELDKLEGDAEIDIFDGAADSLIRPTRAGSLTDGASAEGTFGRDARYLAWTFEADAGDAIGVVTQGLRPRWLDTVVSVYRTTSTGRPTGRALASNDDCDPTTLSSCVTLTAPETGRFVLVVRRYDRGSSGTFLVTLDVTPSVRACGSRGLGPCPEGQFCAFAPEAMCGRADHPGVCAPRPEACITLYDPVCGCDGATYSNACAAASAGVSVEHDGVCASACAAEQAALEDAASRVWILSESDRPITVQVFAGEGTSAPTLASVVDRAMAPRGATATVRDTTRFLRALQPAPDAPEEAPDALRRALGALTDLLHVAIVAPDDPAVVRVILVGRNACSDLVWLESVAIET